MEAQDIHLFDWHRILLGQTEWNFLIEVAIRAGVIYLLLLLSMRMMGKRVASQLSLSELAVILTLGAVAGQPLQVGDRGILPMVAALFTALVFQRGLSWWSMKRPRVERIAFGEVSVIVAEGRLLLEYMKQAELSAEKLFANLRTQGIEQLGQVRRAYLEASGQVTLIRYRQERPGLSLNPDFASEPSSHIKVGRHFVCTLCGYLERADHMPRRKCTCCGNEQWAIAICTASCATNRSAMGAIETDVRNTVAG